MTTATVTLNIPEPIYQRLVRTAEATKQPLETVMLRALQIGSPPNWDDVPDEFQADLAALDRLDDGALWQIARSQKTKEEMERYDVLLDKNASDNLTNSERLELKTLRQESDRFMLKKAQAAPLLRWRGHSVPIS